MKRVLLVLLAALALWSPLAEGQGRKLGHRRIVNAYTTNFSTTENPILEKGAWITGKKTGLDWTDPRVSGGLAFGTQVTANGPDYDDGVAILAGTWGATQTVTATVFTQNQTTATYEEVELWGRAEILPHSIKGYETAFRTTSDGSQYIGIVKWLGSLNSFLQLGSNCTFGTDGVPGLVTGDVVSVTVSGTTTTTITAKVNGTTRCTQTDSSSPYLTGNPGFGLWLRVNGFGALVDFGLRFFSAVAS